MHARGFIVNKPIKIYQLLCAHGHNRKNRQNYHSFKEFIQIY